MPESHILTPSPNEKREKSDQDTGASHRDRWWDRVYNRIFAIREPLFMGSYYLMLTICIGILIYNLWKGSSLENSGGTNIQIINSVILGLFSILATFTVVFFALGAEEAATNSSNSMVQKIINEKFNDKEETIAKALLGVKLNTSKPTSRKSKLGIRKSLIYHNIESNFNQICIWGLVFLVTIFSCYSAYDPFVMSKLSDAQFFMALPAGILGILITLTVVLFALRAARFSQIVGRTASHFVIERQAAHYKQLYHELLDSFLTFPVQGRSFTSLQQYKKKLSEVADRNLIQKDVDEFDSFQKFEKFLSHGFPLLAALCAVFFMIFFMLFAEKSKFIASVTILFVLLIIFTTLFFSGRIMISAMEASEIQANTMTRSELKRHKNYLRERISLVKKIEISLNSCRKAPYEAIENAGKARTDQRKGGRNYTLHIAKKKTESQINDIGNVLMHLRHLRDITEREEYNAWKIKQFEWIFNYLEELWITEFKKMKCKFLELEKYLPEGEFDEYKILIDSWQKQVEFALTRKQFNDA